MDPRAGRRLRHGRRRLLALADPAHHVPHARRHPRGVDRHHRSRAPVHEPHAAARVEHAGCAVRHRPPAVLLLLGVHVDPDGLRHLAVGARAAPLRRDQVHPLHAGGQRVHARRRGVSRAPTRADVGRAELRHRHAVRHAAHVHRAGLALRLLHHRLHDQGADGAVPHLASRCAHRSADGRLGRSRRRAPQDGCVRVPALLHPAVPARRPGCLPARDGAGGDRHRLRRAGRPTRSPT